MAAAGRVHKVILDLKVSRVILEGDLLLELAFLLLVGVVNCLLDVGLEGNPVVYAKGEHDEQNDYDDSTKQDNVRLQLCVSCLFILASNHLCLVADFNLDLPLFDLLDLFLIKPGLVPWEVFV